jgi:cell fate (sporulation/competence/biofilm development) regulator YlbF (YheA/YmcA/DUF963 family)
MEKIDKLLDQICELIEELDEKKQLKIYANKINEDDHLIELISDFEKAKEKYYEVTKYSTHHPDFKEVSNDLIATKEALYNNEVIKEYKSLESKLSIMTLEINKRLKSIVPSSKSTCH